MGRDLRRALLWLAIPSALFVFFKTLSGLGIDQVPHQRIAGLYGGQPGAAVVLLSAFAAFGLVLGRVVDLTAENGHFALRVKASYQAGVVVAAGLALATLVFTRLYANEYAWVWGLL